jgi:hypothetical protein
LGQYSAPLSAGITRVMSGQVLAFRPVARTWPVIDGRPAEN